MRVIWTQSAQSATVVGQLSLRPFPGLHNERKDSREHRLLEQGKYYYNTDENLPVPFIPILPIQRTANSEQGFTELRRLLSIYPASKVDHHDRRTD
jgi:hypothetical protein